MTQDALWGEQWDWQLKEEWGALHPILARHIRLTALSAPTLSALSVEDQAILRQTESQGVILATGQVYELDEASYQALDAELAPLNCFALRRQTDSDSAPHSLLICSPRPASAPAPALWLPFVLFMATVFSVLYTGMVIGIGEISLSNPRQALIYAQEGLIHLSLGLPYAFSILLILGAHELGHFFTMRRLGVASSLPYFIPAFGLSPFGTFGAAIALRAPLRNRRALFDMGASGPLAGLIFALPILFFGLATSPIVPITGGLVEGNSLFYALAKVLTFGRFLPDTQVDVLLNQFAWAGWTGLFVTALNLIPLGQLDGGHILYSLFGHKARWLYLPLLSLLGLLSLFVSSIWLIFALVLILVGRFYAVPLDDLSPLDERRRWLGYALIAVFLLIFVPVPLAGEGVSGGLLTGGLLFLWHRVRRV